MQRVKGAMDFFSEFHNTTPEYDVVVRISFEKKQIFLDKGWLVAVSYVHFSMGFFSVKLQSTMYRKGRENIIQEFRQLLRMHSKAVPAVMVQDAVLNHLRDLSISHDFGHFAESVYNDLKAVTEWFQASGDKFDFMDVYASFRLSAMRESLEQYVLIFHRISQYSMNLFFWLYLVIKCYSSIFVDVIKYETVDKLIDWLTDCMIGWLTFAPLIDWLIKLLTNLSTIDRLIDWLIDGSIDED